MEHEEDCDGCGIPESAVITSVLHIIEYMDEEGELWKQDFSHDSAGNELTWEKVSAMCDYARMNSQAPIIAQMVKHIHNSEEEGDE